MNQNVGVVKGQVHVPSPLLVKPFARLAGCNLTLEYT